MNLPKLVEFQIRNAIYNSFIEVPVAQPGVSCKPCWPDRHCCNDGGPGSEPAPGRVECDLGSQGNRCGVRYLCPGGSEGTPLLLKSLRLGYNNGLNETGPPKAVCVQCTPGKFKSENRSSSPQVEKIARSQPCQPCPAGKYAEEYGTTECTNCAFGKWSAQNEIAAESQCIECTAGRKGDNSSLGVASSHCSNCGTGKYQAQTAQTVCDNCDAGTFSNTTMPVVCTACEPGRYADETGLVSCIGCIAGKAHARGGQRSNDSCTSCSKGKFQIFAGQTKCVACGKGKHQAETAQIECANCDAGTYSDTDGVVVCTACIPGQYTDEAGLKSCINCPTGTANPTTNQNSSASCEPCSKGRYQESAGQVACAACKAGKYNEETGQTSDATGCIECGAGRYSSATGLTNSDQCNDCAAGKSSNETGQNSSNACTPCVEGKYSNAENSTSCTDCREGTASKSGQTRCRDCPAGQRMLPYDKTCKDCVAGWYSLGSVETCTQCEPGRYGKTLIKGTTSATTQVRDSCLPCAPGKYSSDIAATTAATCIPCSPGKYNAAQGAATETQCNECPIGRYGLDVGGLTQLGNCTKCPAGKNGNATAQTSLTAGCEDCEDGRSYQNEEGMASCKDFACKAGEYSANNESIPQTAGEPSTPDCKACSKPVCRVCAAGQYSYAGMPTCLLCRKGEIAPNEGSAKNCTKCRVDETTSCPGAGRRKPDGDGCTECVCGAEKYRANDAARSCKLCLLTGMDCKNKADSTVASLTIKKGFWREDNGTVSLLQCPVEEACVGSNCPYTTIVGGQYSCGVFGGGSGNGSNTTNSSNGTLCVNNGLCRCGHRGPLCAVCDHGYTRFSAKDPCFKCPENLGISIFLSVLFVVLAAACLWLFLWISRGSQGSSIRPIINSWQTMSIVLLTSNDWPEAVKWIQKYVLQTVNLDVISLASPSCLGAPLNFYRRFALTVSGSVVLVGAPWLFSVRKWASRRLNPELWVKAKEQCLHDSILLVLLLYTLVTTQALSHFNCLEVKSSKPENSTYYLNADFTIECYDAPWWGMTVFDLIVIFVFSIGTPLAFAYELYTRRDELEDPETASLLGMLYKTYVKEETRKREPTLCVCVRYCVFVL